ncbi:MAG: hypothetical protein M9965_14165 [Anaerolineae bacterium]|nr:hypothetical protein [Anaerolineae bacterium]
MEFKQYYVAFLKKGPNWTGDPSPELDALQARHQAHLRVQGASGQLLLAGPVQPHLPSDMRGISIFDAAQFESLEACIAGVEADPMFQIGHLAADYVTWYTPATSVVHHGMSDADA